MSVSNIRQHRLNIFGPHHNHGEYMSVRHVSHDLDLICTVYEQCSSSIRDDISFTMTIQPMLTLVGRPIDVGGNMSTRNHQLTLIWLSSSEIFVIRSFSLFPYNVGLRYFVHTLIMEGSYWWNWSHHFDSITFATMTWLTVAELSQITTDICSVCRNHNPFLFTLVTGFKTRLTRRVSQVEQQLPTLPEHLSFPSVYSGFVLLDH